MGNGDITGQDSVQQKYTNISTWSFISNKTHGVYNGLAQNRIPFPLQYECQITQDPLGVVQIWCLCNQYEWGDFKIMGIQ